MALPSDENLAGVAPVAIVQDGCVVASTNKILLPSWEMEMASLTRPTSVFGKASEHDVARVERRPISREFMVFTVE